jgi:hypothetical protein
MDFEESSRAIFMIYDVKLERCFFYEYIRLWQNLLKN